MKVAILSIMNIKHMSMISIYTDILDKNGIEYDLIYVDKYNEVEPNTAATAHRYNIKLNKSDRKLIKLLKYYKFRKYARGILYKNKYDLIIVWRTETAILFWDILLKKFRNNFVLNIRDYFYENFFPIKIIQKLIINNSKFTTISSTKFLKFLPTSKKYCFVNSLNPIIYNEVKNKKNYFVKANPIKLCFIGYVRFFEEDKRLLLSLKNDNRFVVQYFGAGSDILKMFAEQNNIYNVEFKSSFNPSETLDLLNDSSIINNLYGNKNIALDTAISIKYYYSIILKLPILVYKDTYMEEITRNSGHAFVFNGQYENLGDNLYNWYTNLDENIVNDNLDNELSRIIQENSSFEKKVLEVLRCGDDN